MELEEITKLSGKELGKLKAEKEMLLKYIMYEGVLAIAAGSWLVYEIASCYQF